MSDTRLIERWMPIAALSEESVRERRSITALPPLNYLHVWWARRPLVASRAAILASILPADADQDKFMHMLDIHGDPIEARRKFDAAQRSGVRIENPYHWERAFCYTPDASELAWVKAVAPGLVLLDPTAGGGSIPFESARLGLATIANDLNPVASLILKATVEWPARLGPSIKPVFEALAKDFRVEFKQAMEPLFPQSRAPEELDITYLWARTVRCPHCEGLVPLSPNWRLAPDGTGIRVVPDLGHGNGDAQRRCSFTVVKGAELHSAPTVLSGDGLCPFSDCERVIDGDAIKEQAQAGAMGEQLFAVVYKRRISTRTKSGRKGSDKWQRGYREPNAQDERTAAVATEALTRKLSDWEAFDMLPNEAIGELSNYDRGHKMYGMNRWQDLFNPRQLLGHGTAVVVFRSLLERAEKAGPLTEVQKAAFCYLAMSLDKMLDYNARASTWDWTTERSRHVFVKHNFALVWCYSELSLLVDDLGLDWILSAVSSCISDLVGLAYPESIKADLLQDSATKDPAQVAVSCRSADNLAHLLNDSVDVVVMDPPYYDNVMYAELSDFFYVWLKRTAGHVLPELFTRKLTDKDNEAVANSAKFVDQKNSKAIAGRDYQQRMARIFEECRRVLKHDGIMTLMFTHKATGAWDALTKGLIEAGFMITASWPVNTEAESSTHIKNKAAANSTIFLVCRPRPEGQTRDIAYWEDVEPLVSESVRARVQDFQKAGVSGVDLYLASFGPALEEFSRHWPLKRGTPRAEPEAKKRRKQAELFEEEFDPYAVTPEDALDAARRVVKTWRLNKLTHMKGRADLDPVTSWFVLAWDAFRAPAFSYDEGLRLARAVGVDLEAMIGKICEKKGSDIKLWDSETRAAKSNLGLPDGSRSMLDAIHSVAHHGRTRSLESALDMLKANGLESDPQFLAALEAVLEVLPPLKSFIGFDVATGDAKASSDDFEVLEKLRRLAFSDQVDEPEQLALFAAEKVAAE